MKKLTTIKRAYKKLYKIINDKLTLKELEYMKHLEAVIRYIINNND